MNWGAFAKKIGFIIATLIIIAAILVSVSRLLTPVFDAHRADVEKWMTQLVGTPVKIAEVRLSWYRYQPEITLKQVTVLRKATERPILEIRQLSVFFSIPQSLWHWKLVPSGLMVAGAHVDIHEGPSGEITLQGFPTFGGFNERPFQSETKFVDIMSWLSTQPNLILRDIDVRYTSKTDEKKFLTLFNLSFTNNGASHTILGKAILHQNLPTEATIAIQWVGEQFDPAKIKAQGYVYVTGLSLSQWIKGKIWQGWQINSGVGSAKIWIGWDQGVIRKVQTIFQLYNLSLFSLKNKSTHVINRLSGTVGWRKPPDGKGAQTIAGEDILIDLPSHLWPVTRFSIALRPDETGALFPKRINIGYVDLQDIQPFLLASSVALPDAVQQALPALRLRGSIQQLALTSSGPITDLQNISLKATINQLSFDPWNKLPGMTNLAGKVEWSATQGKIELRSNRVLVQYDEIFNNPLMVDQIIGEVEVSKTSPEHWVLQFTSLQLLNSDLAANVSGSLTIPTDASSPVADLTGHFTMQQASHISRYLPLKVFDPELVSWLKQAFLSGEVQSATAVLRGKLKDFPFDHQNGTFLIQGKVKNVDLRYAPDWPIIEHAIGEITFSGRQMVVDVDRAEIFSIPISHVHGVIPYLGDAAPQILTIESDPIQTDFAQGLKFIHATPLGATIGKLFAGMDAKGQATVQLGLTIPLKHPDDTQVKGNLTLADVQLQLIPWNLMVTKLNGQIQFTENTTEATNIQAMLFNKPLMLDLKTIKSSPTASMVRATFKTNANIAAIEKWLAIPFSKVAQGSADVTGDIDFIVDAPIQLHLRSNLVGIAIELPDEYGKKTNVSRDFTADVIVQDKQPLKVKIAYGQHLGAALLFNHQKTFTLTGANLRLGKGVPDWPVGSGLYITGEFDQLNWDKIKQYTTQSSDMDTTHLPLKNIDIRAKRLIIADQQLSQVQLQVSPNGNRWNITITSSDVAGQIDAPMELTSQESITAQFQRMNLRASPDKTTKTTLINMKSLPAISFAGNNVSYNGLPIGNVTFKTASSGAGLTIRSLRITSNRVELQASGEWSQDNVTRLQGVVNSERVSDLINSLGLDAHNFIAKNGKLNFNLSWHDAPYAPSLSGLSGTASLNLGAGRIAEVGEASGAKMDIGRMLSIFSLQTIPRRLSFDFSDVFQKGYSFDSVKGDFTLQNGDAYTNNLRFDGPVAKLGINGRIGLRNKDYDFTLSVTPYVTSSIPLAATLITGNPVVGLAAMAVNTVISSGVSKVTTYYYAVKGPWNNPSWQSVSSGR